MQQTRFKQTEIGKIPEEWELGSLSELAEIIMGQSPEGTTCNYAGNGLPLLNGPSEFTESYPIPIQYTTSPTKIAKLGDILFCVRGSTTGRMNWSNRQYVIGRGLAAIRHKEGQNYNHFIKGIIQSHLRTLLAIATGSTFPNVSADQLNDLIIPIPPLAEQQLISKFLFELDSKIELNLHMNKTLEAIGQAIFKHWFIDFEFPNEKGKPYKKSGGRMIDSELGEIPKEWAVSKLGDFVNITKGVSYKSEELKNSDKALVTLKSIDRGGGLNKNGFKEFVGKYKKEQEIIDGDIVVAYTDITQKAEVLGKPAIVRMIQEYTILIASLDLAIVRPKDDTTNKPYLYYLLKSDNFQNHAFGYANGTTVLHLSSKAVPEYLFVVPDKKLISKFGESMEKLLDRKKKNEAEIENLSLVRDLLLPKLMSGKIRVPVEVKT